MQRYPVSLVYVSRASLLGRPLIPVYASRMYPIWHPYLLYVHPVLLYVPYYLCMLPYYSCSNPVYIGFVSRITCMRPVLLVGINYPLVLLGLPRATCYMCPVSLVCVPYYSYINYPVVVITLLNKKPTLTLSHKLQQTR